MQIGLRLTMWLVELCLPGTGIVGLCHHAWLFNWTYLHLSQMGLATGHHSLVIESVLLSQILWRKRKVLFIFFLAVKINHRTTSTFTGLKNKNWKRQESTGQLNHAGQILQLILQLSFLLLPCG